MANEAIDALTVPGSAFITRFGLKADLRGSQGFFDLRGRRYLVDIVRVYRRETPAAWMVQTKHFNGEPGPEVALSVMRIFQRDPILEVL